MVYGLEKFKEYFLNHTSQYVFIGGTACDILLNELGTPFRTTKDLDMVLIVEALDLSFGESFWRFIEDGGYKYREKSSGENQFYRFTSPKDTSFPKMIELFSRLPNELSIDNGLTPIHIDESIISLSAILLNDEYYNLLVEGRRTVNGFSIIGLEIVILFKIKAWLDMKERKESGEDIDSKNIKKHKNDIFRLLANISPGSRFVLSQDVENDVTHFIDLIKVDKPDLKNLGIKTTHFEELIEILGNVFIGNSEA